MVQLYPWFHFTFKELSHDTSHAKIRVQTKKLCHQQVGKENKSLSSFCHDRICNKLCRDKPDFVPTKLVANSVVTKPDFVTIEPVTRFSCNKTQNLSQQSFSNKICRDKLNLVATKLATNFVVTKPDFVMTEPVTRLSCNKTQILSQYSFSNKLCCDKLNFVAKKF